MNQLANALQLSVGPISILQILRSGVLLWLIWVVIITISRDPGRIRRIPFPAFGALLLLSLLISKQWLLSGTIAAETLVAYGQMAYWVVLWIAACVWCSSSTDAMLILYGIASGAVITSISVFVGFAFGSYNYYEDDLVHASSGWFVTAKMITGSLVCGAAVILYLSCGRRRGWLHGLLASFCFLAVLATYARAGMVAFLLVIVCLGIWIANRGKSLRWQSLKWFFGLSLAITILGAIFIGPATVFSRWNDMSDGEQAGSGRATIWTIATEAFRSAGVETQTLGYGYQPMSDLLFRQYGEDVKHTHNDALDMLLVGGVAGFAWLISFVCTWCMRIWSFSRYGLEKITAAVVFVNYLCHGQLTGQIWGTDSMSYYVLSLTALTVIASRRRSDSESFSLTPRPLSMPA